MPVSAGLPIACLVTGGQRRHDNEVQPYEKGGEGNIDEETVARENHFALRFLRNRTWLEEVIHDPMSHAFDDNRTAFVRKAKKEISVSLRTALALYSLFEIRGTKAIDQAFERYKNPEDQPE